MSDRPLLTLDLDGVICSPPLGINLGIHRSFLDPDAVPPATRVLPSRLGVVLDTLRFEFRRPLAGVREALQSLAGSHRLVLLTGRRSSPARWLRRHALDNNLDEIVINETSLPSAHFKLRMVGELAASAHVDDDGRTAQLLAQRSSVAVFLRDWPRNRGLALAPKVRRVADLAELARILTADTR